MASRDQLCRREPDNPWRRRTPVAIQFSTAAVNKSAFDAVDGSSTGTRVPKMWALVKAPTIRRSYPCKRFRQLVSTSPSRFHAESRS